LKITGSYKMKFNYIVWVGGSIVGEYMSIEMAERLAMDYIDKDYDDVIIEDTRKESHND